MQFYKAKFNGKGTDEYIREFKVAYYSFSET